MSLIVSQDLPTAPPPQICADANNPTTPLGKLRNAMRNTSYTQMNAFLDAFIVFYSDEHLVSHCHLEEAGTFATISESLDVNEKPDRIDS